MGEVADMMLEGILCAGCGAFLDITSKPPGYPVYCSDECARNCGVARDTRDRTPKRTMPCPECERKFASTRAMLQHIAVKHGV